MLDLSVVFGTYNRLHLLERCVESVRDAVLDLSYEMVVVDGGSTDGTLEYLSEQPDIHLIEHGELRGPVAAYNDGFKAARGEYVAYLNDDLLLAPGSLAAAVEMLKALSPETGIISLPYQNPGSQVVTAPIMKVNGRRMPFASFGVLRRDTGNQFGWFDGFYHYYGDCFLCATIQQSGLALEVLPGFVARHANADNALRGERRWPTPDAKERARRDGIRWNEIWRSDG